MVEEYLRFISTLWFLRLVLLTFPPLPHKVKISGCFHITLQMIKLYQHTLDEFWSEQFNMYIGVCLKGEVFSSGTGGGLSEHSPLPVSLFSLRKKPSVSVRRPLSVATRLDLFINMIFLLCRPFVLCGWRTLQHGVVLLLHFTTNFRWFDWYSNQFLLGNPMADLKGNGISLYFTSCSCD